VRATEDHVGNLVAERHSEVWLKLQATINALATSELDNINNANAELSTSLQALGNVIARQNWPSWLRDLIHHTENYRTNHANGLATWVAHLKSIMDNRIAVENYSWSSNTQEEPAFDVDRLIGAARVEFKIDDLFERLIGTLRGLASCEELDSAKAIKDLGEIIAILQRARSGSFGAQHTTWQFVRRFVPNLITAYIRRSDIVGPTIEAYEQTAHELDFNLAKAKERISEQLLEAASKGFASEGVKGIGTNDLSTLLTIQADPFVAKDGSVDVPENGKK
jgi:hypothetical protein